ncbi:hypothetical protein MMC18_004907 [Xylographa bjoerkii]|nr:hypothetical protein [Xylographa bjoerkii]
MSRSNPELAPSAASSKLFTLQSPSGGGTRHFLLHLPTTHNPSTPAPLILAFHGKDQKAAQFEAQTQLSDPKFSDWAIVAYPQGINLLLPLHREQWTGDPTSPLRSSIDDLAFTTDLLDYLISHYTIDLMRIYALGFSNGGGLAYLLAGSPALSARFAAFAIASGAIYKDAALKEPLFGKPLPSRTPIPILHFHGDKDPVIHYDGVGTPDAPTYGVEKWLEGWAKWNGVEGEGEREELYESEVERRVWKKEGKEVAVRWLLRRFAHGWPSTRKQDDDGQRLGPVRFDGAVVVVRWCWCGGVGAVVVVRWWWCGGLEGGF